MCTCLWCSLRFPHIPAQSLPRALQEDTETWKHATKHGIVTPPDKNICPNNPEIDRGLRGMFQLMRREEVWFCCTHTEEWMTLLPQSVRSSSTYSAVRLFVLLDFYLNCYICSVLDCLSAQDFRRIISDFNDFWTSRVSEVNLDEYLLDSCF